MSVRLTHPAAEYVANARSSVAVGLAFLLAWSPEALWARTLHFAFATVSRVSRKRPAWRERQVRRWLSVLPALRTYRPGGWRIRTELRGREHLDAALAHGNGAILWVSRDVHGSNLAGMIGLARAGYRVQQFTRPGHGFGGSAFQRRWLNPVVLRAEARWLGGHLMLPEGAELGAFRGVRARLAAKEVVSIIALRGPARRHIVVEVEGEALRFPSGPVTLARHSGAPLLPVFVKRQRAGRFVIAIEPPLPVTGGGEAAPFVAFARLIRRHLPAERSWIVRPGQNKRPA